jgi:hypothetical protein
MGQDGVVDIPTGSGMDSPGLESRWGARFSAPAQTDTGTHSSLLYRVYRGSLEVRAADPWRYPPTYVYCRG